MGEVTATTLLLHRAPDVTCADIDRALATLVVARVVGLLDVTGQPLRLATDEHRLVVGAARRPRGWDHPASRLLATLHGHVLDRGRCSLAPVQLACGVGPDGLVLTGATVRDDAMPALCAGIELLRDELQAWGVAARSASGG